PTGSTWPLNNDPSNGPLPQTTIELGHQLRRNGAQRRRPHRRLGPNCQHCALVLNRARMFRIRRTNQFGPARKHQM
ncbi:hypothetical protein NQ234_25710, partial [Escherichia coli]|nr:hypothetical protein [Escherichia coli]